MKSNTATSGTNAQFAKGFVAALLTLILLATGIHVGQWLLAHPTLEAVVAVFTKPRFSIVDVFEGVLFLVVLFVVTKVGVWGPRI
jgi:uncharacterized membrane protein YqgA involved in biofilm formation